jgi:hypothetical protein
MAASPLAAALLGGNENAAALDPTVLQVQPELSLASALMKQGIDTSAAYPMQAIARPFQALAGTLMQHDAISSLKDAYASAIQTAQKIYPPTTPLGKALASGDPVLAFGALNQIPKAELMREEPHALGPEQQLWAGGGPVAGLSPQQSVQYYGARSGAEAKARAAYEPGGEGVVEGPKGPQTIPLTAETRRQLQPGSSGKSPAAIPPSGSNASPSAAIPPPQPKSQSAVPLNAPAVSASSTALGTTGQPVMGKPLPNPAIEPAVKADTEELAKDREAATKGQQDIATVRMIQDFLPKIVTGWSAESKLEGARILKAAGVRDDQINEFLKTDVTAGQLLQKKFLELSAGAARGMGAREPGSVIQLFAKAYPNLGTDPQAVTLQTNALHMDRLRAQQLAQEKTNYLNDSINGVQGTGKYRGLKGFNEAFNKSHPPEAYLSAAEAMSGAGEPWTRVTSNAERNAIIRFIPPGRRYLAPDGKIHVMPGAGVQQQ